MSGVNEQILAWHRRNVEEGNAILLARGTCVSGSAHRDGPVRAVYLWYSRPGPAGVGNQLPLCASCCATWRLNAVEDPALEPVLITKMPS